MAKLVVIKNGTPGLAQELNGHWMTVGRADGNQFQIVEPSVSGRHCEVLVRGSELVVRDLLSTNGTFVSGLKITEAVVKAGHTLRLGDVELRFENSAPAPAETSFTNKRVLQPVVPLPVGRMEILPPTPSPVTHSDGEPAKKFHVLFVDDSMAFLEAFTELCAAYAQRTWEIHSAPTADRALAILQECPVDLVVLDIGIPMVDGIQLLGIINQRYPGLKVAVMTGLATEANRTASLAKGADLFIEKPLAPGGARVAFNLLNDLMAWAEREGFRGALREVGLPEIIQMECLGRRSGILEIRNPRLRGQIFIEAGTITHATVETLAGEQAFYRLMSVKGGEFRLQPFTPPPQRTIQGAWELLLMEAARVCDEETVLLAKPAAPQPAAPVPTWMLEDDFMAAAV